MNRLSTAQPTAEGLLLFVKLSPNASTDEVTGRIEGLEGPLIAMRVRAIPDKGQANKALIKLVSTWLGVAKSDISLKRGGKSRLKTLLIKGEGAELAIKLTALLA